MSVASSSRQLFSAERLRAFVTDFFVHAGLSNAHAATIAEVMIWANLRGMDSHGVIRAPRYLEFIEQGWMSPTPNMRIAVDVPAAAMIDADKAGGPIAMCYGVEVALAKARAAGIGLALVRATTHTGALGYYARKLTEQGMLGIVTTGSVPHMAYHGARAAGVATSPLAIGVPGESAPMVLDMSMGVISAGKILQARRMGEALAPGAALDKAGNPTTDPTTASTPMPLGGPKGSGLGLLIECLTSLLVGNPILADELKKPTGRHRQNGFIIAIDVARFGALTDYRAEVARLAAAIHGLPVEPTIGEILLPGERGDRTARKRNAEGIPVPPALLADLNILATKVGAGRLTA